MSIKKKKKQRELARRIRLYLASALLFYNAGIASAAPLNVALPEGGNFVFGGVNGNIVADRDTGRMFITQDGGNAVIRWNGFSIGGNAIVNFNKQGGGPFNVLNYVNYGGPMSEIYGTINANDGNVFLVNPAGVTFGKSAQINVGSLYVSNQILGEPDLRSFNGNADTLKNSGSIGAGELMNLGYINAAQGRVTFVGNRIVLDADRIRDTAGKELYKSGVSGAQLTVQTTNKDHLTIGYSAFENGTYAGKNTAESIAKVNGTDYTKADGYMWVDNVQQLQAMDTNVTGNYALHNSIDAVETKDWESGKGFAPVGAAGKSFSGKFDGLGYSVFDLTISRSTENNVGLFAEANGANIKNIYLVGGSITGRNNVGSVVGEATNNTTIGGIATSVNVTGAANVGGVAGATTNSNLIDVMNTGGVTGTGADNHNIGGIVGQMNRGQLRGHNSSERSFVNRFLPAGVGAVNLGRVEGGHNVGGLAGEAKGAAIGSQDAEIRNRMDVKANYTVGGIVGAMEGGTVQNAVNYNDVTAEGSTTEDYFYYGVVGGTGGDASSEKIGTVKQARYETGDDSGIWVKTAAANAGGIVGASKADDSNKIAKITNVTNQGNVQSVVNGEDTDETGKKHSYYKAGNVGGIAGRAENTAIANAENKENEISGAHNVGGIAGYLGATGGNAASIDNSVNNGGTVYGTGARDDTGKRLTEWVRPQDQGSESNIIGNVGGIVGYIYGSGTDTVSGGTVNLANSNNRGTISTSEFYNTYNSNKTRAIANIGGIVGKLDMGNEYGTDFTSKSIDKKVGNKLEAIKSGKETAVVVNSYNSGTVSGMQNVGGVVGMMYNGSVADSYNLGDVESLVSADRINKGPVWVNMGGVVGSTTENVTARGILYNVYNDGTVGDKDYATGGIHVGGVAGRLSGLMEQSYNTGNVYNIAQGTGGVIGAIWKAQVKNVFNAGNVTSLNKNYAGGTSAASVGGIAGVKVATTTDDIFENVYNIGVIRSFTSNIATKQNGDRVNAVGGLIGAVTGGTLTINNAYTRGELYAGNQQSDGSYQEDPNPYMGAVYGLITGSGTRVNTDSVHYIAPDSSPSSPFTTLTGGRTPISGADAGKLEGITSATIVLGDATDATKYSGFDFSYVNGFGDGTGAWRIYNGKLADGTQYNTGTTPILDCFRPAAVDYFGRADAPKNRDGIDYIQYGTAYNPFMTIMYANKNKSTPVTLDFGNIAVSSKGGFALYNGGLHITNFGNNDNLMYNGTIYSDGDLTIDTKNGASYNGKGIKLGGAAELYGASVTLDAGGGIEIYGTVKATGNAHFKQLRGNETPVYNPLNPGVANQAKRGNVTITGGDIEIYGHISSAQDNTGTDANGNPLGVTTIKGIRGGRNYSNGSFTKGTVSTPESPLPDVGTFYAYRSGEYVAGNEATHHGNGLIAITAKAGNGSQGTVNVRLGALDRGYLESYGSIGVKADGDIYIDSDLRAGGDITLDAATTVLDISNIGQVDSKDFDGNEVSSNERLHNFLNNFSTQTADGHQLIFQNSKGAATDAILAADLWDNAADKYNLAKFDLPSGKTFNKAVNNMNVVKDGSSLNSGVVKEIGHVWVADGEQIKGIQTAAAGSPDILNRNFALKNDIDMFDVTGYTSIDGYQGTFDGRGNRIIGLGVNGNQDDGIFKTLGQDSHVKDVDIYNSRVDGAGATGSTGILASENNGTIENVDTFGNRLEVAGGAGGLIGTNNGTIKDVTTNDVITAGAGKAATLGGIAGVNNGTISEDNFKAGVASSSAVVGRDAYALGGVAGENKGTIYNSDSTGGVVSGLYGSGDLNDPKEYGSSQNVGGAVGVNSGDLSSIYNDSYINGWKNVGGIIGTNEAGSDVKNIVNGSEMYGGENVGGIVGSNAGSIDNGRNNGAIVGDAGRDNSATGGVDEGIWNGDHTAHDTAAKGENIGGLAGVNTDTGKMSNLVNDIPAAIEGKTNVGGIIGKNEGFLSSSQNLMNQGEILGMKYVGGVVGKNETSGIVLDVENTNNYTLGYNTAYASDTDPDNKKYFGGIVGHNTGVVGDAVNNAKISVSETGSQYIGGIIGKNDGRIAQAGDTFTDAAGKSITARGELKNNGLVDAPDSDYVGGLIGENNGTIEKTNLINAVSGTVTGKNYVAGLIGHNTGDVKGSRSADDNYYAYQVYNNGEVTGSGDYVGGLVGQNEGSLTAAYNTGAITGNDYVGGIVGQNDTTGKVDQVFNAGTVKATGGTPVSGTVAGQNDGTITNAYDMEMGNGASGAVGNGSPIGAGTAIDNSAADNPDIWLTYGSNDVYGVNKVLRVFLTRLTFIPYTGNETALQTALPGSLTVQADVNGKIKVLKDGKAIGYFKGTSGDDNAAHSLADYLRTMDAESLSALLSGDSAGQGTILTTRQIQTWDKSGLNPNNLGFDIDLSKITIGPAEEPDAVDDDNLKEWEDKYPWYYGWDKKREQRERKAEVHFVDGGMEIE